MVTRFFSKKPSRMLVNTAIKVFIWTSICCLAVSLVYAGITCATTPKCQVLLPLSRVRMVWSIALAVTFLVWLFMRVVRYRDFCAKIEDGTIKMPPRRPPREPIGHFSSIREALRVLNDSEKLNAWYLLGYAVAILLVECTRLADAPLWLWIPAVVCFGVPETHGIIVRKHTFSQMVWIIQATGTPARNCVGLGLAFYLPMLLLDLLTPTRQPIATPSGFPVAELIMLFAIALWIVLGAVITVSRAVEWKRPW